MPNLVFVAINFMFLKNKMPFLSCHKKFFVKNYQTSSLSCHKPPKTNNDLDTNLDHIEVRIELSGNLVLNFSIDYSSEPRKLM